MYCNNGYDADMPLYNLCLYRRGVELGCEISIPGTDYSIKEELLIGPDISKYPNRQYWAVFRLLFVVQKITSKP